jgi:mannose/fructose/N-acetylgalactosamine-specific phosphotransferase system component IID
MFRVINKAMTLLCYLPYVYLVLFYSFVVRAIIKIGKIPSYNNPDPKDLKFNVHREVIYKVFDWLVYGLIVFAILFLITIVAKKFTVKKIHLILLIIGVVGILLHLFIDPFDTWFLD